MRDAGEEAEKRSISAPAKLLEAADARAEELDYANFSQYIQALIRHDIATLPAEHQRVPISPRGKRVESKHSSLSSKADAAAAKLLKKAADDAAKNPSR